LRNNFEHNLIKGKIAEMIFELMFREAGEFSVFRFGYEYTEEYLSQHRLEIKFPQVVNNISDAPDFLLVNENKGQVYLVEVKYRNYLDKEKLVEIAQKLKKRWDPAYLFVISKNGFYFDPANTIINNRGEINHLSDNWIPQDIKKRYLALVEDYLLEHKHHK